MPASFLSRHRTICDTIEEIKNTAIGLVEDPYAQNKLVELCDEAATYARSMSAKLAEYKNGQKE